MKQVIERIYKRTTEYSHPSQATTTANALDLLSSGIYTEEERFIFELLQNAVDSFNAQNQNNLIIKIVITNNLLVFMHNGTPFSERDLEGLCDIGNGNKMKDAKKIGYKGIGFKSVFMHTNRVTVLTNGTYFKFDKEFCESLVKTKGVEYEDVRLPWQIIPISTVKPSDIDTNGFNVVTFIDISNKESLKKKVDKLLNDTRFLLFLNIEDLRISFFDDTKEIINISKQQTDGVLTLFKNGMPQNSWLIYSKEVSLSSGIKNELSHDVKTPTKLKESQSVEISFAIALDKDKNIMPLNDAVIYTYLPTSYSFGLNFIVNANFITDAGRQQIVKDCAWNEFIFSQIPSLYLNWIASNVAPLHSDWYKVLPSFSAKEDELSIAYMCSLNKAINNIQFVKTKCGKKALVKECIQDPYNLYSAIPKDIYDIFIKDTISSLVSYDTLVSNEVGMALNKYNIASISNNHIHTLLENSEKYLSNITGVELLPFLEWLKEVSEDDKIANRDLSYSKIIPDEDGNLTEPANLFFPSEYAKENPDISKDAKIILPCLAALFSETMIVWLEKLGVQKMSNLSIIETVLCKNDYVNQENAMEVIRFIFKCNKEENIFGKIRSDDLEKLKLKSKGGQLRYASELYLSDIYNPICKFETVLSKDVFVSSDYPEKEADIAEWMLFLKKLGCKDDIKLETVKYGSGSWVMNNITINNCVFRAQNSEYNTAYDGRKFYLGCAGGVCIYALSSPLIVISDNDSLFEFYKLFWGKIFSSCLPEKDKDYIYGETGFGYNKRALLSCSKYLNKSFIEWVVSSQNVVPATDGKLYSVGNILANTDSNLNTFGNLYPILDIEGSINSEWLKRLPFKKDLSLSEYLDVLEVISDNLGCVSTNKDKVNRIYERIADTWDFSPKTSEYSIVRNWGESHKLLSKEGSFESPSSLYLLSSRLSGVNIDKQVFHGKHLENERFVSFMKAMGVNLISDHRVEGLDNACLNNQITDELKNKLDFLTSISTGNSFTEDSWEDTKSKMLMAIDSLEFYRVEAIKIYYGEQAFSRTVYSNSKKFYYVGNFGFVNQELLHASIMEALDIPKKASTIFLAILHISNFEELKEYLEQKGYDTSFIDIPTKEIAQTQVSAYPIVGGEMALFGGLNNEEKRVALEEAKNCVLQKLETDGFDISQKRWDGWTCIHGVTKAGVEYPLVIRSNKSHRNTCISPTDWNQLMKPNAMFAVVTDNGIGTISFRDILKTKENMTIRFSSSNIDLNKHLVELSKVFTYFKGIQFDFESYISSTINRWERFMVPEQSTGELPQTSTLLLPE